MYRRISVINSDEEPPEEDQQEDIDAPQDLDDEDGEDGGQDEDEEGSQRDLEGLDSDTLKRRFANEVGSFMPLLELMIILQRVQWGCEYGAQDDDEADEQDDHDDHPHNFNSVDEHLVFGDDEEEEEEEEETTRARKV